MFQKVTQWRKQRKIKKAQEEWRYSLAKTKNQHGTKGSNHYTASIVGMILYFVFLIVGRAQNNNVLVLLGFISLFAGSLSPPIMNEIQKVQLAPYTALTMRVIPNNPEKIRPIKIKILGAKFGDPIETPEEVVSWLADRKIALNEVLIPKQFPSIFGSLPKIETPKWLEKASDRLFESELAKKIPDVSLIMGDPVLEGVRKATGKLNIVKEAIKKVSEVDLDDVEEVSEEELSELLEEIFSVAQNREMKLYPIYPKDSDIPFLVMLPDKPEKCFRPAPENVRTSWGATELRHADFHALEAKPIRTTMKVEDAYIDVQLGLFLPFITVYHLEMWLRTGQWFLPNRAAEKVATHLKVQKDKDYNQAKFRVIKERLDDAIETIEKFELQEEYRSQSKKARQGIFSSWESTPKTKGDWIELIGAYFMGVMTVILAQMILARVS